MQGSFARLALVCVSVIGAVVLAAGGAAGNRSAEATFEAFPGPARVTYGENIAYRASFVNVGRSTFTKLIFRQSVPVASGQVATLVASTCPSTPAIVAGEFRCDFGSLPPGTSGTPQRVITVVWKVPTLASTGNCTNCLISNGRWTVKEGVNDTSDPNDAFPPGGLNVAATLLSAGSSAQETLTAGGYEIASASCGDPEGPGNLRTQPVVSLANPVATTVCLPAFATTATDLGHATTITETLGNARRSEICIAALGTNCGSSYVDASFSPQVVTHVFRIADGALPKGYQITEVRHNGVLVTPATCTASGECILSIQLDKKTKIWTIVATSPTNGFYDW